MSENKNSFDVEKVVDQIKELVKKGNVSKIIVKHGEDTILNIPLNAGIAGTILALRLHLGQSSQQRLLPSVSNAVSNFSKITGKLWR